MKRLTREALNRECADLSEKGERPAAITATREQFIDFAVSAAAPQDIGGDPIGKWKIMGLLCLTSRDEPERFVLSEVEAEEWRRGTILAWKNLLDIAEGRGNEATPAAAQAAPERSESL